MPKVTVTRSGPQLFAVHVDGEQLEFEDNAASLEVMAGEHALQWFVRGLSGTRYSLAITGPFEARFSFWDQLDDTMHDAGLKWFRVKES